MARWNVTGGTRLEPSGSSWPEPPPGVSAPEPKALAGFRVLIVEDEIDCRELLAFVLSDAGALIESASSATEGFEALLNFHPQLLVSDIGMPVEDGYSFIRRVRALDVADGAAVPAIALSAFTRTIDRERAVAAGFSLYVGKPFIPADLVSAAHHLIASATRPRLAS
jgi:CheY-like chemotaxis protein